MKIISPVDNLNEVDGLLAAGANELYGGYVPEAWRARFSLLASINQRTFAGAQIEDAAALAEIVRRVGQRGGTFSLTLNAPFYSEAMLPLLDAYVDEAAAAGIHGIILADLGLLRRLRARHPQLEYHASTLAHLSNSEAVRFYQKHGVSRFIFPRHLTVGEMDAIAQRVPDARFDAFILIGKCPNTEGLCTFHHSSPDKIWPCEIPYRITPLQEPASPELRAAMARQQSWSRTNRRHGCGLCAIPHLAKSAIGGLKLVGRGAPASQKVRNIRLVREFIELARRENDVDRFRERARQAHAERFGIACSPNVCYYPEFHQAE